MSRPICRHFNPFSSAKPTYGPETLPSGGKWHWNQPRRRSTKNGAFRGRTSLSHGIKEPSRAGPKCERRRGRGQLAGLTGQAEVDGAAVHLDRNGADEGKAPANDCQRDAPTVEVTPGFLKVGEDGGLTLGVVQVPRKTGKVDAGGGGNLRQDITVADIAAQSSKKAAKTASWKRSKASLPCFSTHLPAIRAGLLDLG